MRKNKDEYGWMKEQIEALTKKDSFDLSWIRENLDLIKKLFTKKAKLDASYYYGKFSSCHKEDSIDDITLGEEPIRMEIKSNNFKFSFYEPSHCFFSVDKEMGNTYSLRIYSKEKIPSKLALEFYNI